MFDKPLIVHFNLIESLKSSLIVTPVRTSKRCESSVPLRTPVTSQLSHAPARGRYWVLFVGVVIRLLCSHCDYKSKYPPFHCRARQFLFSHKCDSNYYVAIYLYFIICNMNNFKRLYELYKLNCEKTFFLQLKKIHQKISFKLKGSLYLHGENID